MSRPNCRYLFAILIISANALISCANIGIEKYGDHYYDRFSSGGSSWTSTYTTCIGRGGYLVTLETSEEMEFVNDYIDKDTPTFVNYNISIGLRDASCIPTSSACTNFTWQNVPDGTLTTNGWDDGYPISGDNPCVYIYANNNNNRWRNKPCDFKGNSFMCEYPDPCKCDPCQNDGACVATWSGYDCNCASGYSGANCEIDIDECASSPCQLGLCEDGINSYICKCAPGIIGKHCETNIDECISDPCMHNGTCVDQINSYECTCTQWYTGVHCASINEDCHQYAPVDICKVLLSKSSSSSNNSDRPFLIPFVVTLIVLIMSWILLAGWNIRNYWKAKRQEQAKDLYTKPKSEDIDLTPSAYSGIEGITMETEPDTDIYSEVGYSNVVAIEN